MVTRAAQFLASALHIYFMNARTLYIEGCDLPDFTTFNPSSIVTTTALHPVYSLDPVTGRSFTFLKRIGIAALPVIQVVFTETSSNRPHWKTVVKFS